MTAENRKQLLCYLDRVFVRAPIYFLIDLNRRRIVSRRS